MSRKFQPCFIVFFKWGLVQSDVAWMKEANIMQVTSLGLMSVFFWSPSFLFFVLYFTLHPYHHLSALWLHVGLGVCPHVHLYPRLCLHMASRLARVCYAFIALSAPPCTVTRSAFSSSLFCLSARPGSLRHSLRWRESKQWDAQTQEVLLSSCRLQLGVCHSARFIRKQQRELCLKPHVSFSVFQSPPSRSVDVPPPLSLITTLALCSCTACLNTGN